MSWTIGSSERKRRQKLPFLMDYRLPEMFNLFPSHAMTIRHGIVILTLRQVLEEQEVAGVYHSHQSQRRHTFIPTFGLQFRFEEYKRDLKRFQRYLGRFTLGDSNYKECMSLNIQLDCSASIKLFSIIERFLYYQESC